MTTSRRFESRSCDMIEALAHRSGQMSRTGATQFRGGSMRLCLFTIVLMPFSWVAAGDAAINVTLEGKWVGKAPDSFNNRS